jgi:hypothetical protein
MNRNLNAMITVPGSSKRFLLRFEMRAMTPEERFERIEHTLDQIASSLDRAVRLSVREARAERARRTKANLEFDEKITQLAAAQLLAEEETRSLKASMGSLEASVQAFIDSLRRGGNGHS